MNIKKYLIPLILILLLTFTLIGDCWVSGYDQRIKLTIDHTKIDDTLTNFPVTVFFTDAQAEEIFNEFDTDEDFDRGQFALGDDTLLKAEKELFSFTAGDYISQYPPAQSDTYVKATTIDGGWAFAHFATDPTLSLIGAYGYNAWMSDNQTANQRFHIDVGSAKIVKRIYYENFHSEGTLTDRGVKNFSFWGSNTGAGTFDDLVYANDDGWTQLTTSQSTFDEHVGLDQADPKYITVTNSTAYRYYAFKFADNYGNANFMGVRRIELQTQAPKAIYRVKIPSISSSVDTDYYFYYDNNVDHNTSYIGITGSATAAEVWDEWFSLVVHGADNTTSSVLDSTSNNNDGTKKAANEPIEVTGKVGQAQDFDGTDDYIAIPDSDDWYFGTDNWTISTIVRFDTLGSVERIGGQWVDNSHRIALFKSSDDYIQIKVNNGSQIAWVATNNKVEKDIFYHVVINRIGSAINIYINGILDTNVEQAIGESSIPNFDSVFAIGTIGTETSYMFDGIQDEFNISNTGRSSTWIKATYNSLWDSLLTYGSEETEEEEGNALFWFNF